MITEATVKAGWPSTLGSLKDRTFKFTKGVNILFGPNGCGKTTLMQIMGSYSGCPEFGGWSKFVDPYIKKGRPFPQGFQDLAPGGKSLSENEELASIVWNGAPSFLHMAHRSDQDMQYFGEEHDLLTDMQRLSSVLKRRSSGQERLARIAALCETLQAPPDLSVVNDLVKNANDEFVNAEDEFRAFVARCKEENEDGPVTCLLDEPTRSMDIITTVAFWRNVVPRLAESCQLIIATHCPLVLLAPPPGDGYYNMVDMREGYEKLARSYMAAMIDDEKLPSVNGSWWAS
tara:strand:- start:122726 stop:123589 length:864 start_codon:yes stop_codon:yes gene_type:complete